MPFLAPFLLVIMTLFFSIAATRIDTDRTSAAQAHAANVGGSLLAYRNWVSEYAVANPQVVGAVSDAALNLPSWFRKNPRIGNYVNSGRGYVYYVPEGARIPLASLLDSELEAPTLQMGIARSGSLFHPHVGSTGVVLPVAIPEGSIVFVL